MHTTRVGMKFVAAVVAAVVGAALTGSHYSSDSEGPDIEYMETRMTEALNKEYADIPATVSTVVCPEDAPTSSDELICVADLDGRDVRLRVALHDDSFEYSTLDVAFDAAYVAQWLSTDVSEAAGFPVTLNCGQGLKVMPDGDTFECTAADEFGDTLTVTVTADLDGTYWEFSEQAPPRSLGRAAC